MNDKATYTRQGAADYIGVSLPTLDKLIARYKNPIPCIKVGRRVLIPREGLEEWLKAETERTNSAD